MIVSQSDVKLAAQQSEAGQTEVVWVPGGTFRMGSNGHYPEEAPVHRVTVCGFWIDRTPVTNRQFQQFIGATGHVTTAEIPPDPKDYPGALPHMLYAGSLVFVPPPSAVDLRDWSQWWTFMKGADWGASLRSEEQHQCIGRSSGCARLIFGCAGLCEMGG